MIAPRDIPHKAAKWDNDFKPELLNSTEAKIGDTTAVGTFPPELNGTVDMAGNVSEWTSSLARPYPYDETDGREDPKSTDNRVFRGVSWALRADKGSRLIASTRARPLASTSLAFAARPRPKTV